MIDNVALLITGTLHERDTRELLERCHPLGWFETMPVLCVATNIEELYNSVLIETPLAPYFKGSLSHQDLDELNIEIVRNTLYKNYLEDFHRFVNEDPDLRNTPTSEVMSEVLAFEADRRAINITLNSFGTELSKQERQKLYPDFGNLYPEGTLMLSRADDVEGVGLAVSGVHDYKSYFDAVSGGMGGAGPGNMSGGSGADGKSLEDLFYQKEMEISKSAFTRQFTHAVIYAWVKLREQVPIKPQAIAWNTANNFFLGNPQHYVDRRMYCAEPKRTDWELHQRVLILGGQVSAGPRKQEDSCSVSIVYIISADAAISQLEAKGFGILMIRKGKQMVYQEKFNPNPTSINQLSSCSLSPPFPHSSSKGKKSIIPIPPPTARQSTLSLLAQSHPIHFLPTKSPNLNRKKTSIHTVNHLPSKQALFLAHTSIHNLPIQN